ncbi:MAG: phage related protein [Bacillus sp. (in: firmicutes)]|jgi:4-diphosphocytidyl-2C-methyl-D-erythritol kinase|nr:phage related protein [Bacillus sp. (in: firmicutes)]
MSKVKRVYPEAKTGLINWIEENFHEIDSFVVTFTLKDNTTLTVYDCHTFVEAMGIVGVTQSTITNLVYDNEFIAKPK